MAEEKKSSPPKGCHTEFCVMAHSSKVRKPGLDWLSRLLTVHRYTKFGMASAHALFRCAISRSMMKQLIDLMTNLYENQAGLAEQLQTFQRREEEYGNSDSRSS